jgi:dihydrofolate synthase/folylpolyglutamate synthase
MITTSEVGNVSDQIANFSLQNWLSWFENRYTEEIQLGLERIEAVATKLQLNKTLAKVITIAGTNGKGSTVAALEAIYHAAGYRVASYTSPHLVRFTERIRINQQNISEAALCEAFFQIELARKNIALTSFEMTTLAALWYFKQTPLDIIILEVGMGGRLDATNIVDADVAIITGVDLDHQAYLGHTREKIGYEKAGILRSRCPLFYADFHPPVSVMTRANVVKAPMKCLGRDYFFDVMGEQLIVQGAGCAPTQVVKPRINLKAAAVAIMASHQLQDDLPITMAQLNEAMQTVFIRGRQELIEGPVTTLLDVSHNEQSVQLLSEFVASQRHFTKIHAVFSGLKDKNIEQLIKPMQSYVDYWYPALLESKRAASALELETVIESATAERVVCYNSPKAAYTDAKSRANPGDLVIVYGSFLTVGAVIEELG